MKNRSEYVCEIKLVPRDLLYSGVQDGEIMSIAKELVPEYFTPGTAFLGEEIKNSSSGRFREMSFKYMFPGKIQQKKELQIRNAVAVIITTNRGGKIVLHRNDFFCNTPLKWEIDSDLLKTQVKTTIKTIY